MSAKRHKRLVSYNIIAFFIVNKDPERRFGSATFTLEMKATYRVHLIGVRLES